MPPEIRKLTQHTRKLCKPKANYARNTTKLRSDVFEKIARLACEELTLQFVVSKLYANVAVWSGVL